LLDVIGAPEHASREADVSLSEILKTCTELKVKTPSSPAAILEVTGTNADNILSFPKLPPK
jgi:hypothetical protein